MAFRDDHDAALARIEALEQEKAELARELAEVAARERSEVSERERKLIAQNTRLEKALERARRRKERQESPPAPPPLDPRRAGRWHRASKTLAAITLVLLVPTAALSVATFSTQDDTAFILMIASTALGFLAGLVGLGAGAAATKHSTGAGWGESLAGVYFWPLFFGWPIISVLILLAALIPLFRGKAAMGEARIGDLGRPIGATLLAMALHVQLAYIPVLLVG